MTWPFLIFYDVVLVQVSTVKQYKWQPTAFYVHAFVFCILCVIAKTPGLNEYQIHISYNKFMIHETIYISIKL